MLGTRVLTAAVLAAAFLAVLFLAPRPVWLALMTAALALAASEWARIAGVAAAAGVGFVVVVATLFVLVALHTPREWTVLAHALALLFWVLAAPWWLARRPERVPKPVLLAIGAIVLLAAFAALIELRDESPALLLAIMAIVWLSDSAAFFTGRRFGRRKLAPRISPGKSWEGVWGALAATALYGLCWPWFPQAAVPPAGTMLTVMLALIAVAFAVLGIIGDLFESQLKRSAGVKDSGRLLPGHGGVLDRVDALLPVLPAASLLFAA